MRRILILFACLLAVASAFPADAEPASERELARRLLKDLQPKSIRAGREFCGLIGIDAQGRYVVGPVSRGSESRCAFRRPRTAIEIVATFHTHGRYLDDYDNEVPSIIDLESERQQGTRGYVSTPGGRFWLVDGPSAQVKLICGPKCMPWDPRFQDGPIDPVRRSYTRKQLFERAR